MAYTPTLWAKGDKVTSEKLNKIEQGIVDKVDKETGKTLSTNDFTDAYKTKLDGIEANADKTTIDATLTNSGDAADAKATGDAIKDIENDLDGKVAIIESNLDEKVENLRSLVGTPLKATTASDMTDTSKIYVYTGNESGYTNGDWYYHDGSAWADGGTYNSVAVEVDDTLTVNGMPADAKATGDEISDLKEDLQDLRYAYEIPLRRCYFVRKAWMNTSNSFTDDNSRATNSIPITINSPVKIVSNNADVQFAIVQNSSYILDDWTDSVELSGLNGAYINMRVVSGAEMTGTLVDALHIYTAETGYKEFVQNYTYTIKNTDRFPSYSEYVGVNRYATDLSANNVGCLLRNSSVQSSTFPFICDKDVTVWVGRYNGQTLTVIIDGVATTISEGKSFTIPANTYFTCYWNASAGSKSECTMYVTEYEVGERLLNPTMAGSQMMTNATTSMSVDTSFMVGDKVFMLAQETGGYAVKNGNAFTKSAQSIGNTLGHANSCNYHNGKVYVSDWRDNPNTIYVLTVDTDQDTLTYEKTLTVPLASGRGSTEYFVFDDEKQIYFVGWKTGAAGTDPNTLMYGLYVLTTTGYELAWERQAVRPLILQSAIVHKHYIYIMECQMDYKTVGISRINMLTGEMEHNACTMAGSFVTYEGEGLTPIGDHAFVTSDHNGRTYFIGFSPKAR